MTDAATLRLRLRLPREAHSLDLAQSSYRSGLPRPMAGFAAGLGEQRFSSVLPQRHTHRVKAGTGAANLERTALPGHCAVVFTGDPAGEGAGVGAARGEAGDWGRCCCGCCCTAAPVTHSSCAGCLRCQRTPVLEG